LEFFWYSKQFAFFNSLCRETAHSMIKKTKEKKRQETKVPQSNYESTGLFYGLFAFCLVVWCFRTPFAFAEKRKKTQTKGERKQSKKIKCPVKKVISAQCPLAMACCSDGLSRYTGMHMQIRTRSASD
jgi:hypothetical protein